MRLRNKKTGGLANIMGDQDFFRVYTDAGWHDYDSLAELNAEWEDYKPAEPLIKDEKIRKAVRAFSEVIQEKKHILVIKQCGLGIVEFSNGSRFWMRLPVSNETMDALEDRTYYTIAELCGEEEG